MVRLRRSSSAEPGITRRRHGRGFAYRTAAGSAPDTECLDRIRALAVPPAWQDVWICAASNGHLQAVGTDAAGRRQYLYHEQWRRSRDAAKHARVLELADALPAARRRVSAHLGRSGLDRERVLAVGFRLLDIGSFRIGSESYADEHGTYGVATLRRDQADVDADQVHLEFPAKDAKPVDWVAIDRALSRATDELLARPNRSAELLAWVGPDGTWHDVRSEDVNDYVREVTGGDFTAKDFRTWNATVLMAAELAAAAPAASRTARRRRVQDAIRRVAEHLGNTPAVARSSYVDRRVVDLYLDGVTVELPDHLRRGTSGTAGPISLRGRADLEHAVTAMLRAPARRAGR